ncbi:MAG: GNAT family N-acetyltransferase [Gammaproteobacteria bacterium]|nr:GNAT family N-acetyltransferase [Gammaproteobacteria bacterium]
MIKAAPAGTTEVDTLDKKTWSSEVLAQFDDASLYQTWSYGAVRWGRENLSHFLLKKNADIIAAAQARIVKLPLVPGGIAYIRWGGMWQRKGQARDMSVFREMVRALRDEYALKRGLFLRILPNIMDIDSEAYLSILQEEGYTRRPLAEGGRTLYLDLTPSLEELRANLRPRWRNYLKKAEKSDIEVLESADGEHYEMFAALYRGMHQRKNFVEYVDIDEYQQIQQDLPDDLKMKITLCRSQGEVCAAVICAAAGNMGIYTLGATNGKGLKNRASYLAHWKTVEWLKAQGYRWYDLGGYNPDGVPGTAQFKAGLTGKKGIDARPIGQFDFCTSRISLLSVRTADVLRAQYRKVKERIRLHG